jgi:putative transcriptional regulator
MASKTRKSLFERLKKGLEESIAHAKGELTLKTVEVPALREEAEMSQAIFAKVLHVSAKTVQSWEQGVRMPSRASRRLIHIFAEQPAAVCKVVGLRPIQLHSFKIQSIGPGKRQIVKTR